MFYGGYDYQLVKERMEQACTEIRRNRLEAGLAKGARLEEQDRRSAVARGTALVAALLREGVLSWPPGYRRGSARKAARSVSVSTMNTSPGGRWRARSTPCERRIRTYPTRCLLGRPLCSSRRTRGTFRRGSG